MKIYVLVISIIALSCGKEHKQNTINSSCFDGTNIHVKATIDVVGSSLYAVYMKGSDTLGITHLMPRVDTARFIIGTKESGCGGEIKLITDKYVVTKKDECQTCQ